ncbi:MULTISPECIES: DUF945 domain-containing protein [Campylobacter]|uniref:DUF945 domain-containing protein n=1 Tax=Campylobacter taeniopygiae TaxID=2510188 RepID=A0ABY2THZ2_9BACT|nr:DUF945 domain-containing protein [Campylobacter taeniopygiae]MBZ7964990.1 hypothetical protein [Campylobacter sp. 2457A]TKX33737.1 hypothetical protein CQA75_06240 [Campylobacter taeniopygiae]
MKKWLIIPIIIGFVFIIHIFYMGYINENILNNLTNNKNSHYEITDLNFKKGFLHSKADFIIKDKFNLNFETKISIIFNNNYFSKYIAQGNLSNPFYFLDQYLKDKELANFIITSEQKGFNLRLKFQDINLSNEGGDTLLKNASISILTNKNMQAKDICFKVDEAQFAQFYSKLSMQNFNYKQHFNHPVPLSDLLQPKEGVEELQFHSFAFNNNKIASFYSKNTFHFQGKDKLKVHFQGKADDIVLDMNSKLYQNLNFDKIDFDIIWDEIARNSYDKFDINFIAKEGLKFDIIDLTLYKDNQNIDIDGNVFISDKNDKANIQISSTEEPDKLFSWGQFFGGLNQYFIKNNDLFIMNLSYDNLSNPQLKINDNQFSHIDLN